MGDTPASPARVCDCECAQRATAAAQARIAALEALAADMLSRFAASGDGHRARVGQVQIGKWQAIADGTAGQ